jgi:rod shape-determining protein MreC
LRYPDDSFVLRWASPLKVALQRFTMGLLVVAAFALMILGKADAVLVERTRALLGDALAPMLEVLSKPVDAANTVIAQARELIALRAENERLKAEQARLMQWRTVAERLEAENRAMRQQLRFAPDPRLTFVSGRVVADTGGAFVRTLVVTAGGRDGVVKGQAAVTGDGLVGRVQTVGTATARVLLITDINSRIPVVVERTHDVAMLAGNNSDEPQLLYLLPGAAPQPGDRVITSGHGGVLPAGLPVGVIGRILDGKVRVQPFVDLHRLDYVSLIDYHLPGVIDPGSDPGSAEGGAP